MEKNRENFPSSVDFVDYETAIELKGLGFSELCCGYYHIDQGDDSFEITGDCSFSFDNSLNRYRVGAPLLSQAQRWLRDERKMSVCPFISYVDRKWSCQLMNSNIKNGMTTGRYFPSYERALASGIKLAINDIKTRNK